MALRDIKHITVASGKYRNVSLPFPAHLQKAPSSGGVRGGRDRYPSRSCCCVYCLVQWLKDTNHLCPFGCNVLDGNGVEELGARHGGESWCSGGESCEWHLREEKSNNMYLLPLFPLEKEMGGVLVEPQ